MVTDNPSGESAAENATAQFTGQDVQAAGSGTGDEGPGMNTGTDITHKTSESGTRSRVLAVIGDGAFHSGQMVVDDTLMNTIRKVVPDILSASGYKIYVEGHTDNMPIKPSSDKRYMDNMELSFLRAKAVAAILAENGISHDRLSVTGYGESRPIASNESEEGRIKNRRVEIRLVPVDKEL